MTEPAVYEVYAIRYAHGARKRSENFVGGDPHDGPMPLDYFVWAIVGEKATYVVDMGFEESVGNRRGRQTTKSVSEGLAAIGIRHEEVRDVILTHFHYDHCGNNHLFPNARFHVQDAEMEFATGRCMCHPVMRHPFEEEDVVTMVRRVFADRVVFHDGDAEIADGISLHLTGGHSKGLQCVRVRTRRGYVVLASDVTHFYEHMETDRPFIVVVDVGKQLEGYRTLRRLADTPDHIIPGHDPLVLARYPAAAPGLENWVARLDLEPKPR